jgi:hypothetical protein
MGGKNGKRMYDLDEKTVAGTRTRLMSIRFHVLMKISFSSTDIWKFRI